MNCALHSMKTAADATAELELRNPIANRHGNRKTKKSSAFGMGGELGRDDQEFQGRRRMKVRTTKADCRGFIENHTKACAKYLFVLCRKCKKHFDCKEVLRERHKRNS